MRFRAGGRVGAFLAAIAIAAASQVQLSVAAPPVLQKQRSVSVAIASVAPAGCVKTGARLTITGNNFGDPKSTGYSLGVQVGNNRIVPVTAPDCSWSSTSIAFTFPAVDKLEPESLFSLGIVSGRAFVAKTELKTCAAVPRQFQRTKTDPPVKQPSHFSVQTPKITTEAPTISSPLLRNSPGSVLTMKTGLFTPRITSVFPLPCVMAGADVTLGGSDFGSSNPADYTLALQTAGGHTMPVADPVWKSTSISFKVPAEFEAGSSFTAGVFSGGALLTSAPISVCSAAKALTKRATRVAGTSARTDNFKGKKLPAYKGLGAAMKPDDPGAQPADTGWPPAITSISPLDCVNAEDLATAYGVNLGTSRQSAGFSIDIQIDGGTPSPIKDSDWSPTSVGFIVPPEAEAAGWFVLGITFESEFYAQQSVGFCNAFGGMADYGYYDYGSQDYGGSPGSEESPAAGPKGARLLGAAGVNVQVQPPPTLEETAPEQLPQPGKRAVGGKLLAMKSLARRGLYKVNRECDLYDPQCPCCRKDDLVCLEKQSDSEAGDSTWVVRWKNGAKTADNQTFYTARSAEDDLEAVTKLQCEPAGSGTEGSAGNATLICR